MKFFWLINLFECKDWLLNKLLFASLKWKKKGEDKTEKNERNKIVKWVGAVDKKEGREINGL